MIFRKYISSLLLATLIMTPVAITYADNAFQDLPDYSEYTEKFDSLIENLSSEQLLSTADKVSQTSDARTGELKEFMDYVMQSISLELEERKNNTPIVRSEGASEETNTLTEKEKLSVQQEILSIQETLMEEIISFMDSNITLLHSLSSYEETGDFSAKADFSIENFMKFSGQLDISEYVSEVQLLNQSFDGRIDLDYISNIFDEDIDIKLGTHLSFITKDGGAYISLKDTSIDTANEEIELEITPFIEKLEKLSEENTYLSLISGDNAAALEIFESFNSASIKGEIQEIFSQTLFEAYEKKGDGYLLRPTKHLCDIGKEFTQVFDPFGGKTCTEKQYSNMLEDLSDSGFEMILQTGKTNSLSINFPVADEYETMSVDISWREQQLTSLFASLYYSENPEITFMDFEYVPKRHLSFQLPKGDDDIEVSLYLDIDRKGDIDSGEVYMRVEDNFTMSGTYENHRFKVNASGEDSYTSFICESNGELREKYMNLDLDCRATNNAGDENIQINAELDYDGRNNKNNLDLVFDAEMDEDNYVSLDVSNIGTRRVIAKSEILAPENTKDIAEFMSDIYDGLFYDYNSDYDYEDYTYEQQEFDDYTQECYIYDNGDKDCYKSYNDKYVTCIYTAETKLEDCETYEYGYILDEFETENGIKSCYTYDSGDRDCYEYTDEATITCNYIAETDTEDCVENKYNDYGDYTYEEEEFDDHSQECYIYDSGDKDCYKTYNDKSITCIYTAETNIEDCETYEYGYIFDEFETENGIKSCYTYDSGNRDCYEYTDEATITCTYIAETDTEDCVENNYDDWYDNGEYDY